MATVPVTTINGVAYQLGKKLGEGGYAVVFLGHDTRTMQRWAIKRSHVQSGEDLDRCRQEIKIMTTVQHPSLMSARAYDIRKHHEGYEVLIVMDFAEKGHAVKLINSYMANNQHLPAHEILNILWDVCSAVCVLHSQSPPIAHRDLKAENVLNFGNGYKLCDFGSSTPYAYHCKNGKDISFVEEDLERTTTVAYRAPEQCNLMDLQRIDEKVDVWALGVLLYTLCFFQSPFPEDSPLAIAKGRVTIPASNYPSELTSLITYFMTASAPSRPTAAKALDAIGRVLGRKGTFSDPTSSQPIHPKLSLASSPHHSSSASASPSPPSSRQSTGGSAGSGAKRPGGALMGMLDWVDDKKGTTTPRQPQQPAFASSRSNVVSPPSTGTDLFNSQASPTTNNNNATSDENNLFPDFSPLDAISGAACMPASSTSPPPWSGKQSPNLTSPLTANQPSSPVFPFDDPPPAPSPGGMTTTPSFGLPAGSTSSTFGVGNTLQYHNRPASHARSASDPVSYPDVVHHAGRERGHQRGKSAETFWPL